jgi:hypothetical protein
VAYGAPRPFDATSNSHAKTAKPEANHISTNIGVPTFASMLIPLILRHSVTTLRIMVKIAEARADPSVTKSALSRKIIETQR